MSCLVTQRNGDALLRFSPDTFDLSERAMVAHDMERAAALVAADRRLRMLGSDKPALLGCSVFTQVTP